MPREITDKELEVLAEINRLNRELQKEDMRSTMYRTLLLASIDEWTQLATLRGEMLDDIHDGKDPPDERPLFSARQRFEKIEQDLKLLARSIYGPYWRDRIDAYKENKGQ